MQQRLTHHLLLKPLSVLLLWIITASANAASLGKINVTSSLGESFRADIELLNIAADEAASLTVRTGSAETFRRNGVEFNPAVQSIRASLVGEGRNTSIVLRSTAGIYEPVLDLLIELNSDKGTFLKKYTVLLDLPNNKSTELDGSIAQASARQPQTNSNTQSTNSAPYLSLKPSLSLKTDPAKALFELAPERKRRAKKTADETPRKKKKIRRQASQDRLTVVAPQNTKTQEDSPQQLAKRLVKSGITDAAQIEALINALTVAKAAAIAKETKDAAAPNPPVTSTANATTTVVSVIDLPVFAPVVSAPPVAVTQTMQAAIPAASAPTVPTAPAVSPAPGIADNSDNIAWYKNIDSTMVLAGLGLALAVLIAAFAWMRYKNSQRAQAVDAIDDYPLTQMNEGHPNAKGESDFKTELFDSAFVSDLMTPESMVHPSYGHTKLARSADIHIQVEPQNEHSSAKTMLSDLLAERPQDNAVRIMLMSLLADNADQAGLQEQLDILRLHTKQTGPQWKEGLRLYDDFVERSKNRIELTSDMTSAKNKPLQHPSNAASTENTSPLLSLDLSHPTVFSPVNFAAASGLSKSPEAVKQSSKTKRSPRAIEADIAVEGVGSNKPNPIPSTVKNTPVEFTLSLLDESPSHAAQKSSVKKPT